MTTPAAVERSLTVTWHDPLETAERGRNMRGIDFLRAVAGGELPPPPIAQLLGMSIESVDEGRVVFGLEPGEQHFNPIGAVHGGVAATLLDSVMGCAVQSVLPDGAWYTTLDLTVNYIRPIGLDTGRVLATGTIIHRGSSVATAEGRVTQESTGKLLAHATTTCLVRLA